MKHRRFSDTVYTVSTFVHTILLVARPLPAPSELDLIISRLANKSF